ncbi:uncharacterized protein LOC115799246 [Archocentrus centrarchus]|uniref:uncharacterized protein LOC115799246 n=1 Tax=Archocentrus centrarchus TaxID=63155 RepID=UPI0011EA4DBB|nr:uncharacterized protein LOC115799246 [Archocentrus centrarchus]
MNVGWSVTMSAEEELERVQKKFVWRVSNEVLAQLVEALVSDGVLNHWEKKYMILEEDRNTHEKAHHVIKTIMKKGDKACWTMIERLKSRDPLLSSELGLSSAPSSPSDSMSGHHKSVDPSLSSKLGLSSGRSYYSELERVKKEFVWRVSNKVLTQLLDDLVSDGVLDYWEKKPWEETKTTVSKALCVIDTVRRKGDEACRTMIKHLQTIDPLLSSELGLSSAPSSPSGDSQVKLDPEAAATKMMQVMEVIKPPSCFTPAVQTESEQISYRFSFPGPGLFQCSLTGLVFDMTQEAKLQYRIIQWDESVLTPTGKTPAGPLFDIKGPEDAVRQLHFPHCETKEALHSGSFLSVIHFSDDETSVLKPLKITDTHVVVEVPHLSAFGVVLDLIKDLRKTTIRGQILLFLRKPNAEANKKYVDMLLLPRNVPLLEVKEQHRNSDYISVASNCKLIRDETYTVHCEAAMKRQPNKAKFDMEFGPNYHATFVIDFALNTEEATITVQDQRNTEVWKHDIDLTAVPRSPLVSSSNLQELHQSGDSLERTPPVTIGPVQRNDSLFFLSWFLPRHVQRSVPRRDDRNQLLSILEDLNGEDFANFKWYLRSESWNNIEPIKVHQLSRAERRDVVDLMLQTYEITGAVKVMERILKKIRRNDLVEKLRAERRTEWCSFL